jgi:hypothetical protein
MPFKFPNLVQERSATTGTGDVVLAGAVSGYFTFASVLSDGDTFFYRIQNGSSVEGGIGTYHSGANSVSRTTVRFSSAGGTTKISLTGNSRIWIDVLGEWYSDTAAAIASLPGSFGTMASQNANAVAITGGTLTGVSVNGVTLAGAGTLNVGSGGTLGSAAYTSASAYDAAGAASAALTTALAAIPGSGNPSASVGLAAINGSATSYMRSDAAPALSQAIIPTWTGLHTFAGGLAIQEATNKVVTLSLSPISDNTAGTWIFPKAAGSFANLDDAAAQAFANDVRITAPGTNAASITTWASSPTWSGVHTFTPAVRTSGVAPYFTVNAPADTTLTASTEAIGVNFAGATRQHATGAITTQREYVFAAPTYSAVGASVITTAATLAIAAAPIAGTNVTITNPYALLIQSGNTGLPSGHVMNYAAGDYTVTHSSRMWTINAGATNTIKVGQNSASTTYNIISLNGNADNTTSLGLIGGGGSDNNLYINTPLSGVIIFRPNAGVEAFRLTTVGTTARIFKDSSTQPVTGIQNTSISGYSGVSMLDSSGADVAGFGYANASAAIAALAGKAYLYGLSKDLVITGDYNTAGNGIIIKSGGNVGIGLAAGSINYKLDIATAVTSDRAINVTVTSASGSPYGAKISITGAATTNTGLSIAASGASTNTALEITAGAISYGEAVNVAMGTSTGTKWGTATGQKQSWWGATPVVQQVLATGGGATVDNVISMLQTLGLCKQS